MTYGQSDHSIKFLELCSLLDKLGFQYRVKGSHFIYYRLDIPEIINIQAKNGMAKPYQVKQIREIIIKYKINIDADL